MFPNKMQYLGGHWDQCIRLSIDDQLLPITALSNGLEYLYQNNHLQESQRWLDELLNVDARVNHHNLVKVNSQVRPVNRLINQNFDEILSEIMLRPEVGSGQLIPDKYLHGDMLKLKTAMNVERKFDKHIRVSPINVTNAKFGNILHANKPNLLSSCSLLWMDMFELALFVLSKEYTRQDHMGVIGDPYGAVLGLILKACKGVRDIDINKVSRLNRQLILEQWYQAQEPEDEYLHLPFVNDFASLARQKFFSADPYTITRVFTLSQVVLHNPLHGESIWKHTLNLVQNLPDVEYQLVDFEALLNPGERCYQMYSLSLKALSDELTNSGAQHHV
ncbi:MULTISPECIES: hypothetical protein [Vibrio]|uniref:hypothetical protein n=1 Tax=Vibrio TaxID=662 RepID=UPI00078C6C2C|nr:MULTISPECIES: hypothetical protein [Vibrio]BAU70792.1 hypothetical protein [Vibrio sp. 04Ya108]BCN27122.1 hypothetical protein VYA_43140 [Vibrio alfacsensis]